MVSADALAQSDLLSCGTLSALRREAKAAVLEVPHVAM